MGGFTTAVAVTTAKEIWTYQTRSLTDKSGFTPPLEEIYDGEWPAAGYLIPTLNGRFTAFGNAAYLQGHIYSDALGNWMTVTGNVSWINEIPGEAGKIRFARGSTTLTHVVVYRVG